MLMLKRALPLSLSLPLSLAVALACAAPDASAAQAAPVSAAAPVGRQYVAPPGAWSQFTSEMSSADGLATGKGITVALLSTGVDTSAPGLAGKVTEGPSFIGTRGAGVIHDTGTVTASLILGVSGVVQGSAPDARILGLRVEPAQSEPGASRFFATGNYDTSESNALARAITYAVAQGARVIEIVAGTGAGGNTPALASAVSGAVASGAVLVAPDGWFSAEFDDYLYPVGLSGVVGVASVMLPGGADPSQVTGGQDQADQSARNNSVLIAGPGDWVPALADGWGPYGVSTASAYVTATVALIKQRYPGLSPALVERALAMSARDKPPGGYSTQVGFGVVDPYDAVLDAGKLAGLAAAATPGPAVAAATAHFGSGPLPGPVSALPPAPWQEIASWTGIVVGATLLALAAITAIRRRRRGQETAPHIRI